MTTLPQRAGAAQLPALTAQCDAIADFIASYDTLIEPGFGPTWIACEWNTYAVHCAREALARLPAMREAWAVVNRPASADDITAMMMWLVDAYPNLRGAELDRFVRLLRFEVADLRPSRYALVRGCRRVWTQADRRGEFLSVGRAVAAIARQQRAARKIDYLLSEFPLAEKLARIDAAKREAEEMARRRAQAAAEEDRIEDAQWLAERCPPHLCPAVFTDDELELLGKKRGELLAWRKDYLAQHPEMRRKLLAFEREAVAWRSSREE